ncbi:MAG: UDP-N-acetylmuramoyl-L-alanyl-D-glutamate--2,6-diaminopimelate ligase [Rikenellaceae bacterium]|jgi:UDP-N-acetylmuramoyl-L-alanyl-D-glutamate--2,6-diaminopimelate ligase|nr:UDP-N-acetylmuramoyl-L-alanyl-D-glutamate--2,6-diaminopimelate ligase [Rikenellaceae bacterium]
MNLKELLADIELLSLTGSDAVKITALGFDSRAAAPGMLFAALRGEHSDGHDYIGAAVEKGVSAILCETLPETLAEGVTCVQVPDSRRALGLIASAFYGHPSRNLALVGVTGTNGKTTTATLLYDLFRKLGYRAGLISTVVYKVDDKTYPATHTTPDPIRINELMARMVDTGCDYCFMEVSSHSIVQCRTAGLTFRGGIFSNITHDHLDYHGTFAEYIKAKKRFFDELPKEAFALVNIDDKNGRVMVQNTKAGIRTYSLKSASDLKCKIIETLPEGMLLNIDGREIWVKFLGGFNAYNLLAVYASAVLLGARPDEVLMALSRLEPVNGRFQTLRSATGVTAVVDYAHTPDALSNVLATIQEILPGDKKLYTVVGCGGNRDRTKRPVMARVAVENSSLAILTSDNPRKEKPEDILADMTAGLAAGTRCLTVVDRREAIRAAILTAAPGDIVLVAGKGHEDYQIIGETKYHFDDKEEVLNCFAVLK